MSVLVLSVLRCPDGVVPETRRLTGGECTIGRGAESDWVLDDPERVLSKRHCTIGFRGGAWYATDSSTNGLFLNQESEPLGRGQSQELRDGDRLRLGAWEIEARIEPDSAAGSLDPFGALPADHGAHRYAAPARGGPASPLDPFADLEPPVPHTPFNEPEQPASMPPSAALPDDFDPLAPDPAPDFEGPVQGDHSPSWGDAFRPPPAHGPMAQGGAILGAGPIPEDFDPFAPEPDEPAPFAPRADSSLGPTAPASPPPAVPPAALPGEDDWSDLARPPAASAPVPPPDTPPAPPPGMAAGPRPPTDPGDLLAAFLRGAGLPGARIDDPVAQMEQLGAAFRALVSGLRRALIARAAIKGEFRIEQTMIRTRGNNPLKFSAGDADALAALLGAGRHTEMGPPEAVADALEDIRLHELASMAAMQTAIRALVETLAPGPLLAAAKGGILPGQKQAAAFEAYEALHAKVTAALSDDFDSVFGKAFARAYEQALAEARSRPRE